MNGICGGYPEIYDHNENRYNQIKEEISIAYLRSICSYLGLQLKKNDRPLDNKGFDLCVKSIEKIEDENIIDVRPLINIQLKCTSVPEYDIDRKYLKFDLDVRVFNNLREPSTMPSLLFVHLLPTVVPKWVYTGEEYLSITEKMYWLNPLQVVHEIKEGQKEIRLSIPLENVVNMDSISKILYLAAKGERIPNVL